MKFGKKLLDIARPEWSGEYVDYKRLKKLLKAVAPATAGGSSSAPSTSPVDASPCDQDAADQTPTRAPGILEVESPFTRPRSELIAAEAAEGAFMTAVLLEVHKANSFFLRIEAECSTRLAHFAALLPSLLAALAQRPAELALAARPPLSHLLELLCAHADDVRSDGAAGAEGEPRGVRGLPADLLDGLRDFVAMCEAVDYLRKFAFVNYLALTKICKKHDKHVRMQLSDALLGYVAGCPFYSSTRIAEIWTHAQCLASELLAATCQQSPEPIDFSCGICLGVLSMPVVLSCTHAFCHGCLAQAATYNHQCPLCKKGMDLNPHNYHIDSVLERFLGEHFPADNPADAGLALAATTALAAPVADSATAAPAGSAAARASASSALGQAARARERSSPGGSPPAAPAPSARGQLSLGWDAAALSAADAAAASGGGAPAPKRARAAVDASAADASAAAALSTSGPQRSSASAQAAAAMALLAGQPGPFDEPRPPRDVPPRGASEGASEAVSDDDDDDDDDDDSDGEDADDLSVPLLRGPSAASGLGSEIDARIHAAQLGLLQLAALPPRSSPGRAPTTPSALPSSLLAQPLLSQAFRVAAPHELAPRSARAACDVKREPAPQPPSQPSFALPSHGVEPAALGPSMPPSPGMLAHDAIPSADGLRKRACERCHKAKAACEGGYPCHRCIRLGSECFIPEKRKRKNGAYATKAEGAPQARGILVCATGAGAHEHAGGGAPAQGYVWPHVLSEPSGARAGARAGALVVGEPLHAGSTVLPVHLLAMAVAEANRAASGLPLELAPGAGLVFPAASASAHGSAQQHTAAVRLLGVEAINAARAQAASEGGSVVGPERVSADELAVFCSDLSSADLTSLLNDLDNMLDR